MIFACDFLPKRDCYMLRIKVKNGWSYWRMYSVKGFVCQEETIF